MLNSNQAFREQSSSDYSDIKRENLAHRKGTLETIGRNQRLLVERNLNFLERSGTDGEGTINEYWRNDW
jgi:hypothetical protein